jgi:hypothetical protein
LQTREQVLNDLQFELGYEIRDSVGGDEPMNQRLLRRLDKIVGIERGGGKVVGRDVEASYFVRLERNSIDESASAEFRDLYDKLEAALFMTILKGIVSWAILIPLWGQDVPGCDLGRGVINSSQAEGERCESTVDQGS